LCELKSFQVHSPATRRPTAESLPEVTNILDGRGVVFGETECQRCTWTAGIWRHFVANSPRARYSYHLYHLIITLAHIMTAFCSIKNRVTILVRLASKNRNFSSANSNPLLRFVLDLLWISCTTCCTTNLQQIHNILTCCWTCGQHNKRGGALVLLLSALIKSKKIL